MLDSTLKHRLSPMDAFFLYMEREEQPMVVGAVCVFDKKIPFKGFIQNLESRLHLLPRYRQRVIPSPLNLGHPTWEDDPDFDVEQHVEHVKLPAPGSEDELRHLAAKVFEGTLDRSRPLWEIRIVDGLSGGRGALILKAHHCMVDGISGIQLAYVLFDMVPHTPPTRKKPYKPAPIPEPRALLFDALWDTTIESVTHWTRFQRSLQAFGDGFDLPQISLAVKRFVSTMGRFLLPFSKLPFNGKLAGGRRMAWSEYPFADARAIRAVCGGTVNDVALSVISGAIRGYLQHRPRKKHRIPHAMRVLVPVNVRHENERGTLGNRISFLPVAVPLHLEDPVERLQEIHLHTREMKETRVADAVSLMFDVLQGAPPAVQAMSLGAVARPLVQSAIGLVTAIPPANMICTNVPGPNIPLYVMGRRLLAMYPTVPVCLEMGINFAITSYDQKLFLAITGDAKYGEAVEGVAAELDASFAELREAASVKEAAYVTITREAREQRAPDGATNGKAAKVKRSPGTRRAATAKSAVRVKSAVKTPARKPRRRVEVKKQAEA